MAEIPSSQSMVEIQNHPPTVYVLKFNTDTALDLFGAVAGAGLVTRDHTEAFVDVACRRYINIVDPFTVEQLNLSPAGTQWLMQGRKRCNGGSVSGCVRALEAEMQPRKYWRFN
jgi:hypothetical protein